MSLPTQKEMLTKLKEMEGMKKAQQLIEHPAPPDKLTGRAS